MTTWGLRISLMLGAGLWACADGHDDDRADLDTHDAAFVEDAATHADAAADVAASSPPSWQEWRIYGGDLEQRNARTDEKAFTADAMATLQHAWSVPAPGVTGTPVLRDGVLYWADWMGGVYAVAPDSGELVWNVTFDRGFTSSPAADDERLYLGDRDGLLYALDPQDGAVVWSTRLDDNPLAQIWGSPAVADGVVVVGVGGKSTNYTDEMLMAFRGSIHGLDAESGEVLWRFDTTEGLDGEPFGPGVAVWSSAAIDVERGVLYIGTGNSYFSPASPYSDSIVALELQTGEVVWSRQFTHDDNFTRGNPVGPDSDVGATPNLFQIDDRDVVGVGDKAGNYYLMDREDGELIWSQKLSPGSSLGGVIGNAAVADGRVYVGSNENFLTTQLYALDAKTGEQVWKVPLSGPSYGSVLRVGEVLLAGTAGNFSGTAAGPLLALDPATGQQLWTGNLEHGRAGGIAVSGNHVFVPTGFHLFMDQREPIAGSLMAFRLGDGGGGMSTDVTPMPLANPTYEPTFRVIYDEIFKPMGCTETFCHGKEGKLSLRTPEEAYAQLVGVEAAGELCAGTGLLRVDPEAPEASLLLLKGEAEPPCGVRMPVGGMLDAKQMDQLREWIAAGAKDD